MKQCKHFLGGATSISDGIFFLDFHRFVSKQAHLKVTLKWLWTEDASEFFVAGDAAWSQFVRAHVEHWCKHGEGVLCAIPSVGARIDVKCACAPF